MKNKLEIWKYSLAIALQSISATAMFHETTPIWLKAFGLVLFVNQSILVFHLTINIQKNYGKATGDE